MLAFFFRAPYGVVAPVTEQNSGFLHAAVPGPSDTNARAAGFIIRRYSNGPTVEFRSGPPQHRHRVQPAEGPGGQCAEILQTFISTSVPKLCEIGLQTVHAGV